MRHERKELQRRYDAAKSDALKHSVKLEWQFLERCVEKESSVVIAVPAQIARNLVEDARSVYVNYETLVGSRSRRPASPDHDRHRHAVAGLLFGHYSSEVRYGNLAIANEALQSYGDLAFRLRPDAVKKRTSFLEENSFAFVATHGLRPGDAMPAGYRAVWENRTKLALAKTGCRLRRNQPHAELRSILVNSSADRSSDDFIEAHIYGGFTIDAVDTIAVISTSRKRSRETMLDIKVVVSQFKKRRATP